MGSARETRRHVVKRDKEEARLSLHARCAVTTPGRLPRTRPTFAPGSRGVAAGAKGPPRGWSRSDPAWRSRRAPQLASRAGRPTTFPSDSQGPLPGEAAGAGQRGLTWKPLKLSHQMGKWALEWA